MPRATRAWKFPYPHRILLGIGSLPTVAYKVITSGIWGYALLVASLANTNEVLDLVKRPGNRTSSDGTAEWMNRATDLMPPILKKVGLRGKTYAWLTHNFDRWDDRVRFVFGYNASRNIIELADALPKTAREILQQPAHYDVKTEERCRPDNAKKQVVKEREFKNIRLQSEHVAQFDYPPTHSRRQ